MTPATHTAGRLIPCRSHEDHTGPLVMIEDEDDRKYYEARPFTKLVTTEGIVVATAHDLFEYAPGDAEHLAACWNACNGLTTEQVTRLGEFLNAHNADEVEQMLKESGA